MCFGGGGPTEAENKQAAEQKVEAEAQTQKAVQERAQQKAEDVEEAISASTAKKGPEDRHRWLSKSSQGSRGQSSGNASITDLPSSEKTSRKHLATINKQELQVI